MTTQSIKTLLQIYAFPFACFILSAPTTALAPLCFSSHLLHLLNLSPILPLLKAHFPLPPCAHQFNRRHLTPLYFLLFTSACLFPLVYFPLFISSYLFPPVYFRLFISFCFFPSIYFFLFISSCLFLRCNPFHTLETFCQVVF